MIKLSKFVKVLTNANPEAFVKVIYPYQNENKEWVEEKNSYISDKTYFSLFSMKLILKCEKDRKIKVKDLVQIVEKFINSKVLIIPEDDLEFVMVCNQNDIVVFAEDVIIVEEDENGSEKDY